MWRRWVDSDFLFHTRSSHTLTAVHCSLSLSLSQAPLPAAPVTSRHLNHDLTYI